MAFILDLWEIDKQLTSQVHIKKEGITSDVKTKIQGEKKNQGAKTVSLESLKQQDHHFKRGRKLTNRFHTVV